MNAGVTLLHHVTAEIEMYGELASAAPDRSSVSGSTTATESEREKERERERRGETAER